jgi:cysteine desulfurase
MTKPTHPIYLDNAAATPVDPAVLEVMQKYFDQEYANPSALYGLGRQARAAIDDARATIANSLAAKPTEIVFTSCATESNNLAIQGVLRAHPGSHWVTTAIEHDSVLALEQPMSAAGHPLSVVPVSADGIVDAQDVAEAVTDTTVLVSVMLANNEIGTIQPLTEVAKRLVAIRASRTARGIDRPLYLHTDAAQAAAYINLHVNRLGVHLLTLNGSKMYGPKGAGVLYVRTGTIMNPLMYGGGQERGRRSGTENVPAIVGLGAAVKLAAAHRQAESARLEQLRDQLARQVLEALPGTSLNGHPRKRLPGNLNFTIPDAEGETLVLHLDQAGIQVSTGSACSIGNQEASHVLTSIGCTADQARTSLRLTLGRQTTAADIAYVAKTLPAVVAAVRNLG